MLSPGAVSHSPESSQGRTVPQLSIIHGLPPGVLILAEGVSIVGRGADATLTLVHPTVSRRHCRIERSIGRCWVEDLGSQMGTQLDGKSVVGSCELMPGNMLQLGSVQLRFELAQAEDEKHKEARQEGMSVGGIDATEIDLSKSPTLIGRAAECDVVLNHPEIAPQHARVESTAAGFRVFGVNSRADCRINGQHFDEHLLVYGDQLDLGPFHFRFDGRVLQLRTATAGGWIAAKDLCTLAGERLILDNVSLTIEPGQFVGILGPSGAGKSTFLGALTGLRSANSGQVLLNGADLYAQFDRLKSEFGWVPQQDIVHRELTVVQALTFAAELRLPRDTPEAEIDKLVARTAAELGLEERMGVQIGRLSGGQLKRVSVGVELLSRPTVLFLDEPTSGLDPAAEFKLMELLRHLADTGCTVVCTTHVMENVYLMDQIVVLAQGALVFAGNPEETRGFFGVRQMTALYDRLEEQSVDAWKEQFDAVRKEVPLPPPLDRTRAPKRVKKAWQIPLLLRRQWAILQADWRNFAILFGQPLVIGALLVWAAEDMSLKLFFAYIATLWLGCSNGAQEIVSEIPIYRRERIVGLKRSSYLLSKWVFIGLITILQSAALYLVIRCVGEGIGGSIGWQIGGLGLVAMVAVAVGLAISALARSSMQAVLLVPLFIIPQILLSGFTVPAYEMKKNVLAIGQVVPSFAAQTVMDVSLLWEKKISGKIVGDYPVAYRNLTREKKMKIGQIFDRWEPGTSGLAVEAGWLVLAYLTTTLALRSKERN